MLEDDFSATVVGDHGTPGLRDVLLGSRTGGPNFWQRGMGTNVINNTSAVRLPHTIYISDDKGACSQDGPTDKGVDLPISGIGAGGSGVANYLALWAEALADHRCIHHRLAYL